MPEGVWYERTDGTVAFHALPPPTDEDVLALTERIVRRVARLLRTRDSDADATDPPELDDLAHAQAEAIQLPGVLSNDTRGAEDVGYAFRTFSVVTTCAAVTLYA